MSAIGSVIVIVRSSLFPERFPVGLLRKELVLPGRFADAGQLATVRHLAQAYPAQPELAEHGLGPAAALAAGVTANGELRLARGLVDQRLLGHQFSLPRSSPAMVSSS